MPEWSKGSDLSPDVVIRVGSNPTSCTCRYYNVLNKNNALLAQLVRAWDC